MACTSCVPMVATLFFTFFFLQYYSSPANANANANAVPNQSGSSNLVRKVCSTDLNQYWNYTLCVETLGSNPNITSAPDLFTMAVAVIKLGLANATKTSAHVNDMLKSKNVRPAFRAALKECVNSYGSAVGSFKSALTEVTEEKEYMTANYDVLIAADSSDGCEKALASAQVHNSFISNGNKFVKFYGFAAYVITDWLGDETPPPLTSP